VNISTQPKVDWRQLAAQPDPCVVCGGTAARMLYPATFHASLDDAPNYFLAHRTATAHGPIVACNDCGFTFTSPRFSADAYDRIYSSIPVPHEGVSDFDAAKQARFRRLAGIVRQHVPAGSRLVDFGCGDGAFLRELNDPAAIGFEIGAPERRRAGVSDIVLGNWASAVGGPGLESGTFAAVTAFDVLEHLPRLEEDVALVRSLLVPGGLFFASVPDIASLVARAMGKRWNMLLLEHLWYFSPATFDRFMARFGFERVAMQALPFDAPLAHVVTRLAQTFGMRGNLVPRGLARMVLPAPAGIMLGTYRAV
jgi:SAM-dependent methyltransferase